MLFHTWPFALFLLVVLPVFFALRKTRLWLPWLTIASYFFYGWWNPYYLFLVVYSTLLDFLTGGTHGSLPARRAKRNLQDAINELQPCQPVRTSTFCPSRGQ